MKPSDFTTILDDLPNQNVSIAEQLLDNVYRPNRHNINPANRPPRSVDPLGPRNISNVCNTTTPKRQVPIIKAIYFKRVLNDIEKQLKDYVIYDYWANETEDEKELRVYLDDTNPSILEHLSNILTKKEFDLLVEIPYDYLIFWE